MEFLKDIAAPQSLEHFHLILFVAAVSSVVFIPYTGFVLGSSFLSLLYNRKGRKYKNSTFVQLSRSLVNIGLYNKSLIVFLAIIPGLSIVFCYAQILQQTPAIAVNLAGIGFLFLLAGFALLYSYKYTFRVRKILESYQTMLKEEKGNLEIQREIRSYGNANIQTHLRSGRWGIFFLGFSLLLYSSALSITANPSDWTAIDSVFSLVLSGNAWLKTIQVFVISAGITGFGILLFSFAWGSKEEPNIEYSRLIRIIGVRISVLSLLVFPVIILLNIETVADKALSGMMYFIAGFSVLLLFLAGHSIYEYVNTSKVQMLKYGMTVFIFAASMMVVQDYVTIETATRNQAAIQAYLNKKSVEELSAKYGLVKTTFTGEDIYNTRCSSCHLLDQKKVGPPYYETVPKYQGNKANLIAFILNPVRKNPEYPPMANPGLKPVEADSIAGYLIRTVEAHFAMKNSIPIRPQNETE